MFVDDVSKATLEQFSVQVYYDEVPLVCEFCCHIGHGTSACKRRWEEDCLMKELGGGNYVFSPADQLFDDMPQSTSAQEITVKGKAATDASVRGKAVISPVICVQPTVASDKQSINLFDANKQLIKSAYKAPGVERNPPKIENKSAAIQGIEFVTGMTKEQNATGAGAELTEKTAAASTEVAEVAVGLMQVLDVLKLGEMIDEQGTITKSQGTVSSGRTQADQSVAEVGSKGGKQGTLEDVCVVAGLGATPSVERLEQFALGCMVQNGTEVADQITTVAVDKCPIDIAEECEVKVAGGGNLVQPLERTTGQTTKVVADVEGAGTATAAGGADSHLQIVASEVHQQVAAVGLKVGQIQSEAAVGLLQSESSAAAAEHGEVVQGAECEDGCSAAVCAGTEKQVGQFSPTSWAAEVEEEERQEKERRVTIDNQTAGDQHKFVTTRASPKKFHVDLPIDFDPMLHVKDNVTEEMSWSKLIAGEVKLVVRRSVSPVGRSSEKLKKLRSRVDYLEYDAGKTKMWDREDYLKKYEEYFQEECAISAEYHRSCKGRNYHHRPQCGRDRGRGRGRGRGYGRGFGPGRFMTRGRFRDNRDRTIIS